MINPAELAKRPRLPEMSLEDRVEAILRRKIYRVLSATQRPIRFPVVSDPAYSEELFRIAGENELSTVNDIETGREISADRGTIQEIGIAVMGEFGLNQLVYQRDPIKEGKINWPESDYATEVLVFPSQQHPGLVFERERKHLRTDDSRSFSVAWRVRDAAPKIRFFDVSRKFRKPAVGLA